MSKFRKSFSALDNKNPDHSDWDEVFNGVSGTKAESCTGSSAAWLVDLDDIEKVLYVSNEEDNHLDYCEWEGFMVVEVAEQRFAMLWGWCDTTGWGCEDGTGVTVSDSLENLVKFGLSDSQRAEYLADQNE